MASCGKKWPFYRADDSKVGDVMPCYFDDRFFLYYLRFSEENPNNWSARETTDFVRFTEDRRTNIRGGTGEILKAGGRYHIYKAESVEGKIFDIGENEVVCGRAGGDRICVSDTYVSPDEPFVYRASARMTEYSAGEQNGALGLMLSVGDDPDRPLARGAILFRTPYADGKGSTELWTLSTEDVLEYRFRASVPNPIEPGEVRSYALCYDGKGTFTGYADGKLCVTVENSGFRGGYLGLLAWQAAGVYSDISLTRGAQEADPGKTPAEAKTIGLSEIGFRPLTEKTIAIGHYSGNTPYTFEREPDDIPPDDRYYVSWAWRDPRIIRVEEENCWWMLVATNQKEGAPQRRNACVGLLKSKDLLNWEYCPPLFAPQSHEGTYECPDLFRLGDWYYLVYSNANQDKMTHYVKSRSRSGPWIIPDDDTLDSFLFYAGRVAGNGKQTVIAAWNAERTGKDLSPKFGLRDVVKSGMAQYEDFAPLGYAGDMVIHQLGQAENGDLRLELLPQVEAEFQKPVPTDFVPLFGGPWQLDGSTCSITSPSRYAAALRGSLPERCLIHMTLKADCREAGIVLGADKTFCEPGLYLRFQPKKGRMQAMSGLREGTPWVAYCLPFAVEEEVFVDPDRNGDYEIRIVRAGELVTVYVNGKALSLRSSNMTGGSLGLYVFDGSASFRELETLVTVEESEMPVL